MRRFVLCLVIVVGALAAAPTALGDGPVYVTQGGAGVASPNRAFHYVTVPDGKAATLLERVDAPSGAVFVVTRLPGSWGIATIGSYALAGQGLSHDGRTLVLASPSGPYASPSRFLVVDPVHAKVLRTIVLHGYFTFDALSPDASKMYVIQYTRATSNDLTDYVVRGYDMHTNRLLPGKIADRSEHEDTMVGYAMTRTTSADGRWVYTLYQKPTGEPFVHALDTVAGVAHCIDLPENKALYNIGLSLRNGGRTLSADWRSGRPWLTVATGSWKISYPSSGFPWAWGAAGIGGCFVLLAAGALVLRRRRGEELQEHPGQELGLA